MNQLQPKTDAHKLSWCFGVVMTLLLAGCNSGDKDPILAPDNLTGLTQIVVTPANPSIPAGLTQSFEALGVYADGTSLNISNQVSWSSATTTVATVNTSGMVRALTTGSSMISAAFAGKSGQTTVTVLDATLVSLTVAPTTSSAISGNTVQYSATGIYSNGTSQSLTSVVAWTSSDTAIASLNPNRQVDSGLASAKNAGTTTITASLSNINASGTLTVSAATLLELAITPNNPTLIAGLSQQMTVIGTYNNNTVVNLTTQAVWLPTDLNIVTMNDSGNSNSGLATAKSVGTTVVSASFGGKTSSTQILVTNPELLSLSVTPATMEMVAGLTQQYRALGVYNNGTTADITSLVTWSSSDTTVAFLNANLTPASGLATGANQGSTQIVASWSTPNAPITASASLVVNSATVTSITVTPQNPQLINGYSQQFVATALYSNQANADITAIASWSSNNPSVVTMNPNGQPQSGLATSVAPGTAIITATIDNLTSGSTQLSVVDAALSSIVISPLNTNVTAGSSVQFSAVGTFSNGTVMTVTHAVVWQTSDPSVASFNPNFTEASGLATGLLIGNVDVIATLGAVQVKTNFTVSAATLVNIAITPVAPTISVNQSLPLQLTGTYTDGSVANLTNDAVWSSTFSNVAMFNPNQQADSGLILGKAAGTSLLQAQITSSDMQLFSASTLLTVTGSLALNPTAPTLSTTAGFVMIASQGMAITGDSQINEGDIAILDVPRSAYSGFTETESPGTFTQLLNGLSYAPNDLNPPYLVPAPYASSAAYLSQVKTDLTAAVAFLAAGSNPGASTTHLNINALFGASLTRGVFHLDGDVILTKDPITLDAQGDPNSVFILVIRGDFKTDTTGSTIVLINGAQASNVFWQISGSTLIGENSEFVGTIISNQSIQVLNGSNIQGRLFSAADTIVIEASTVSKSL